MANEGLNSVELLGNLAQDPELRNTTNSSVLNFRIATTENVKRNQQWQEHTEWHNIVVWGRRAEALANLLGKGDKVLVVGHLRTRKFEDREGITRYRTDIEAEKILLCGQRGGGRRPAQSQDEDDRYPDERDDAAADNYRKTGGNGGGGIW